MRDTEITGATLATPAVHPSWSLRTRLLVRTLRGAARRVTGWSPQRARASLDTLARLTPPALDVRRRRARVGGIACEWFVPTSWAGGPTFLHVHGGGYALCSSITHRMMITDIARASGARGLGVDYRLAPEHPYPAALDDCESAYHGLLQHGVTPDKLVLTGDSAGGAIVLTTLVRLRERGLPMPRAAVLMSPWVDLTCSGRSTVEHAPFDYIHLDFMRFFAGLYLAGEDPATPDASPARADLSGLPPLLVQAGGAEVLLSDIQDLCERAEAQGVEVTLQVFEGMVHAFQGFTFILPEAREAMQVIGRWIREKTGLDEPTRSLPPSP